MILSAVDISRDDPFEPLGERAAEADVARAGPLSLIGAFDLALARLLKLAGPAPDAEFDQLLRRLEANGLIAIVAPEPTPAWRWLAAPRIAVHDDFVRREPDRARELEGRLARWFLDQGEPSDALAHAMASQSWPLVADVIEKFWRLLAFTDIYDLARALVLMPQSMLAERPIVLTLRHIVPVPAADPATMPAPPLLSAAEVEAVAHSDQAPGAISLSLALSILHRTKGGFRRSVAYGDQSAAIIRAAQRFGTPGVDELIAGGFIQISLPRFARGELDLAIVDLLEAYEYAPVSERASAAYDSAGRLVLAYALRGETSEAIQWLDRQAVAAPQPGQLSPAVDSSGLGAQALLAAGVLDALGCSAALDQVTPGPTENEVWPQILHIRTLFALGWGDQLGLLDEIGQARASHPGFAETRRNDGIAAPVLAAAEANLLMSLGRGNQAWAVLNYGAEQHPLLAVAQARLALLTDDADRALDIAEPPANGADRPITIDLALISAVALHRLGRRDEAIAALADSIALAGADQLYAFTAVPRADLIELNALLPASAQLTAETLDRLPDVYPARVALLLLTQQEQLVLTALADDKTMAKLAAELHLSEGTITTHRRHLYRKLGANSREAALAAAAELGLLNWTE
jgi:LuxR family transcriptional regulator, maltose regulon positive regulatory protein